MARAARAARVQAMARVTRASVRARVARARVARARVARVRVARAVRAARAARTARAARAARAGRLARAARVARAARARGQQGQGQGLQGQEGGKAECGESSKDREGKGRGGKGEGGKSKGVNGGKGSRAARAAFDHAQADVNNVMVLHCETGASHKHGTGEEVQYEDIESVGRMPVSSHALAICLAVFGDCLAIMVEKPCENLDKDDVGLAEAPLLE